MARKIKWLDEPEAKDYEAARSYLSLFVPPADLEELISGLTSSPTVGAWHAKDVLRAARLPLLTKTDSSEVAQKLIHIKEGVALSPILLVCVRQRVVLQIADGYHRTCAVCLPTEDGLVPGRLVFDERRAASSLQA